MAPGSPHGCAIRDLDEVFGGVLWARLAERLRWRDVLAFASAASWHRRRAVRDPYVLGQLEQRTGVEFSEPSFAAVATAEADDLRALLGESAPPAPSGWALLTRWARAQVGARGPAWPLRSAEDAVAVEEVLSLVDASVRPPKSQAFRLILDGFDPQDVDELLQEDRDHIFTVGQDDVALYAGGDRIGELFISVERSAQDGALEVCCLIGAPVAASGAQLRPLTFHVYACFPPLSRPFAASTTVDAAELLTNYPSMCMGELRPEECALLRQNHAALVLLFVEF